MERQPSPIQLRHCTHADLPRQVIVSGQRVGSSGLICEALLSDQYIPIHVTVPFGLDPQSDSAFTRFAQSHFIDYDCLILYGRFRILCDAPLARDFAANDILRAMDIAFSNDSAPQLLSHIARP